MKDGIPDYQSYSIAELHEVLEHLNREKYPERYDVARRELRRREVAALGGTSNPSSPSSHAESPNTGLDQAARCARFIGGVLFGRGHDDRHKIIWGGGAIGAVSGVLLGTLLPACWMHFRPLHFESGDGMDRGFAMIGILMMWQVLGFIIGIPFGYYWISRKHLPPK